MPSSERRRREDRGAEGVGFLGTGVPLSSRLGGLGSVVSSPSGVRGGASAASAFYMMMMKINQLISTIAQLTVFHTLQYRRLHSALFLLGIFQGLRTLEAFY